ncbi:MAG TPA: twin-arginine translocation signal domain-containing protein, partial [Candidatus Hydrogenedentes bacterium]|nr:twin-arginine translocation signal domain-containing protein [Candidatus Hydrogenedentota bacterium]
MRQKDKRALSRRGFMTQSAAASISVVAAVAAPPPAIAQYQGAIPPWTRRFPSYVDAKTGATIFNLTPGDHDDRIVYQTHPMWTQDMRYFMFYSTRSGDGARPHLLDMNTGEARPVFAEGHQRETMTWRDNNFYCVVNHDVCVVDVIKRYHNEGELRVVGRIPEALQRYSGDITVDADGGALYFGAQLDEAGEKYAVAAMNLASGETRIVVETDFKVGHFQANPVKPGQIMFCWETGGDAPQRAWFVNADG